MIKLLVDIPPFKEGEVITVGKTYDSYLVRKNLAVWVKVPRQNYRTK
jgi:hypothetical protein